MNSFWRKNSAYFVIFLLAVFPIARWAAMSPLGYRFFSFSGVMTSLGQIAGLAGLTLFSVSLILSSRLPMLDKYFYGLDRVYKHHHDIGALAFSLILFHPLFLVFRYIQISTREAALFFLLSADQALNFGIIALFLMIVLMALTFYVKLKYHIWKFFHKFMVVVFIFAVLHSVYVVSDISRDNILRFYLLGLAAIGLAAGFWRAFLRGFFNKNFEYEVVKLAALRSDVTQIEMAPKDKALMKFKPGQFIFVSFASWGVSRETHPFSLASAPDSASGHLRIVAKSLGDFTSQLKNLKINDKVSIEGPFGKFSYAGIGNKDQIWIAGGIGVTPFLSMAGSLEGGSYKADLYYSVKTKDEAVLLDELAAISQANANFRVIPWYADEKGYLTGAAVSELSGGLRGKDIFLCGPPVFMESLREQLMKLGVAEKNIHWERFNFV